MQFKFHEYFLQIFGKILQALRTVFCNNKNNGTRSKIHITNACKTRYGCPVFTSAFKFKKGELCNEEPDIAAACYLRHHVGI